MEWGDMLMGLGSLAGTAYSIYKGEQSNETADKYYDIAGDAAKKQVALAEAQWKRYTDVFGPLEAAQVKESLLDIEANRPLKAAMLNETQHNIEAYRPIEDQMISDASKTGAEFGQEIANRSSADVTQGFDKAQAINTRNLTRMGVNPNSGKFANQNKAFTTSRALADAGGRTSAFTQGNDLAFNRKSSALNYRRGFAMPQTTTPNGNAALSSAMQGLSSGASSTAALAGVAANAGAQNNQTAGYLLNKGTKALGGVNWDSIGNSISGMFNSGTSPNKSAGNMPVSV